jgi:nicotinamidase-related amidase
VHGENVVKLLYGKEVFDTLGELLSPEHTAVIVIDMANMMCHEEGPFGRSGADLSMLQEMTPRLINFLQAARAAGVMVVHTHGGAKRAGRTDAPGFIYYMTKGLKYGPQSDNPMDWPQSIEGSWESEFIEGLEPLPDEPVIPKQRSNGFIGTNLDMVLQSNGIKTVVITGGVTQGCVESTVRAAADHDYYVVFVEDCIASVDRELHEAALMVMSSRHDCITSENIIGQWAKIRGP